eukprot:scaffold10326_cov31-Tisochrysis_lutea.AAC.6
MASELTTGMDKRHGLQQAVPGSAPGASSARRANHSMTRFSWAPATSLLGTAPSSAAARPRKASVNPSSSRSLGGASRASPCRRSFRTIAAPSDDELGLPSAGPTHAAASATMEEKEALSWEMTESGTERMDWEASEGALPLLGHVDDETAMSQHS